jgi:8-amino-7-oxononanoate synthase
VDAACEGARRFGVGAGASHLVCGHHAAHAAAECSLAAYVSPCEGAAALLFSSGYLASLAVLTALAGRGDAIFADRLNHACLNDGALLSRATLVRYRHADPEALGERVRASTAQRKVIATDAVFSMDGDVAPLARLLELADRHDAWLVVDDAHGFGVLGDGRGSLAEGGLTHPRIVYMGTLGKAAGVCGAFVAAHPAVIETMVQTARPYIYTTATPPLIAHALRTSLELIESDEWRRSRVFGHVARLKAGLRSCRWKLLPSNTPIQPLAVGTSIDALTLSRDLEARGILVPAIRPPTVPQGTARLRISLSADHTPEDVDRLVDALSEIDRSR